MGLMYKQCTYCGGRVKKIDSNAKLTWYGGHKWIHNTCAAAAETERRRAESDKEAERRRAKRDTKAERRRAESDKEAERRRAKRDTKAEKAEQRQAARGDRQKAKTASVVAESETRSSPHVEALKAAAFGAVAAQFSPQVTDTVEFDFPPEVVFQAATEGITKLSGFEVTDKNPTARYLSVTTKASRLSLGEQVTVSVSEVTPKRASMRIGSAGKLPATMASKNRTNVEQIVRATSDQLDQNGATWTNELIAPSDSSESESPSIEERLLRLDALHTKGLINEDEFEARKQAILSEL